MSRTPVDASSTGRETASPEPSGTTTQLINTLTGNGATAVVFPTGQNAQNNASLMQAYKNAGLTIGNHSWDHPHLINMSYNDVQSQLSRTQQVIQQTAGVTPNLFRPPYGETNSTLKQIEQQLGLTEIIWDVDSTDWNTLDGFSPGPMILALFPDNGVPVDLGLSNVAFHTNYARSLEEDHPTVLLRADDEERIQQGSAIFDALHAYFAGQKRRRA